MNNSLLAESMELIPRGLVEWIFTYAHVTVALTKMWSSKFG